VATAAARVGAEVSLAAWHDRGKLAIATKADPDDLVTAADLQTQQAVLTEIVGRRPDDALRGEEDIPGFDDEAGFDDERAGRSGIEWWVDPIDGTTSFVYGRADWSVSVAAVERGSGLILAAAVAEPVLGTLTSAGHGLGAWSGTTRLVIRSGLDPARALVEINLGTASQRTHAGAAVGRLATGVRDVRRGGSAAAALAGLAHGRSDGAWLPGLQPWDGAAGVLIAAEAGATVGDLSGAGGPRWPATGDVLAAAPPLFDHLRDLLGRAYRSR
jgi:myo-inositol-1(or 4)-monophosphatase